MTRLASTETRSIMIMIIIVIINVGIVVLQQFGAIIYVNSLNSYLLLYEFSSQCHCWHF